MNTRRRTMSRGRSLSLSEAARSRNTSFDVQFHTATTEPVDTLLYEDATPEDFTPSEGLTSVDADKLLQQHGRNELEEKSKSKWTMLLECFTAPMPIMIWVAIIIEASLENWTDMYVLIGLQMVNGFVGFYEMAKAANAVAALKNSLQKVATAKRDGEWREIAAWRLVPGDLISLGAGAAVPADCSINEGQIDVDQSALTGESLPVTMFAWPSEEQPKMGSTVTRGEVEATVVATGMNTFFGTTANLIQSVDEMGHLQKILITIMAFLIILSTTLCSICFFYLWLDGEDAKEAISFTVVLLIASIPVAIEVVVTATMALGSRQLAASGAIVSRLSAIEEMAGMNMLCSDKTGTLTLNKMVIQENCPTFQPNVTRDEVLLMAQLAAKWREPPKDALDTMVLGTGDLAQCDAYTQLEYTPFDPTLKRTEATLQGPDGREFKVTKGAPHIVLALCPDKNKLQEQVDATVLELAERGIRSLAVARTNRGGRWEFLGVLTFLDPPRPDTKLTIERARAFGVEVKMITGDHAAIARETARQLGMGDNILGCEGLPDMGPDGELPDNMDEIAAQIIECNGFAQVFPEHKFILVEALRRKGFMCGMTGDGVNDAPALKKADIGIAVAGATDAARAAADLVLTQEGLMTIVEAIQVSRMIFARMRAFVIYRVACTFMLLVFFFIAVLLIHPVDYDSSYDDFWSMPVLALIIITLLNDGTIISIAYDSVQYSESPDVWNLKVLYTISTVLGTVTCCSSLWLLTLSLNSIDSDSLMGSMGIDLDYQECMTTMYLYCSLCGFLTLFCARTHGFFWEKAPGLPLLGACAFALGMSTIFAYTWPFGTMDAIGGTIILFVWVYALLWFLVQDVLKVLTYKVLHKYNIFGIDDSHAGTLAAEAQAAGAEEGGAGAPQQRKQAGGGLLKGLIPFGGGAKKGGAVADEESKEGPVPPEAPRRGGELTESLL